MADLSTWAQTLRDRWQGLGRSTKIMVAGGAVVAVIAAAVPFVLNRPEWVTLGTFEPKNAATVMAMLDERRIDARLSGEGYTILVDRDDLDRARLGVAEMDLVGPGSSPGWSLFDEVKLGTTEYDRNINNLRARQGELENTIRSIAGIENARVHLVLPEKTAFLKDQQPASAAVMVATSGEGRLPPAKVRAIVSFITMSVPDLKPEYVTVIDRAGRLLTADELGYDMPAADSAALASEQQRMHATLQGQAQSLLDTIFGPGNAAVRVFVELRMDQTEMQSEVKAQGPVVEEQTIRKDTTSAASGGAGAPGTAPAYQASAAGGSQESGLESAHTARYDTSVTTERTVLNPAAVSRIRAAVALNLDAATEDQKHEIRTMIADAVGADIRDVSVVAMPFGIKADPPAASEPEVDARPAGPSPFLYIGLSLGAAGLALGAFALYQARRRQEEEESELIAILSGSAPSEEDLAAGMPAYGPAVVATADQAADDAPSEADAEPEEEPLPPLERAQQLARENPRIAARIVERWLKEEN